MTAAAFKTLLTEAGYAWTFPHMGSLIDRWADTYDRLLAFYPPRDALLLLTEELDRSYSHYAL